MATTVESTKLAPAQTEMAGAPDVRVRKVFASGFELDVAFALHRGITILFGASGAGKTTLLDCIAGITPPNSGRVTVSDRVLFDSERRISIPVRNRNIGYVFQDLALFPHLSVESNVAYGLAGTHPQECEQRVGKALDSLGIAELRNRRPAQLSGGERQRVALARALVTGPSLLLLDEPLAALDLPVRMKIADDLRRSIQNLPIPVLYVTHSRDEVFMLGEKLLVLERGKVISQGTPHEVLSAPRGETVAQLAGFENIFDGRVMSIHEDRGTMTCRIGSTPAATSDHARDFYPEEGSYQGTASAVPIAAEDKIRASAPAGPGIELETPLVRADLGAQLRVGISAGDILLATSAPVGLSARNILPGKLLSLTQRDALIVARVDCGVELSVHLTLGARDSLELAPGRQVWVIVKTHSCHLLAE
jgi:molybdenum ABC transporter ATP-binding protein